MRILLPIGFVVALFATAAHADTSSVVKSMREPEGLLLEMNPGTLRLQVWSDRTIRVTYSHDAQLPELKSFTVIAKPSKTSWDTRETSNTLFLTTDALQVQVNKRTGAVAFLTPDGKPILSETDDGKEIAPPSQPALDPALPPPVRQSFVLPANEGIYGLGQHQNGQWNYRGHTVHLQQRNTEVGIPVLLSSNGYVLLWDNPAVTDISVGAPIPTATPSTTKKPSPYSAPAAGENMVRWSSETGKAIDYYFCYGPKPDDAMQQYRMLSGAAPMMPKWLWGFWQSKERYRTQDELLEIAHKYRDLNVPIDGIIQDWRYWPDNTWGSHAFDKTRYPDPAALLKQLHDLHFHMLISVWPKFDLGTSNIEELEQAGAMYEPVIPYVFPPGRGKWYDPFSPQGRSIYWHQISSELFALGIDGWWLDAPEPELSGKWGEFRHFKTAQGLGATVFNAYPLMHSTGIYQGQRAQTDEQRVVILTRSAYAGQQRNSAITWSGDITGTWQVFRNQVPAGLNFSLSGIPYWNTDIGGFFGDRGTGDMHPADPRYQELFTRWFQFGAFCPMFRVHGSSPDGGTGPGKEIWRFDEKTQGIWKNYVNLRYRLIPYIYSHSWQVTSAGSTLMRPLVMDFPNDPKVLDIGDQYLFGPALMVNPVTSRGVTTRKVYLPNEPLAAGADRGWYNFWTGAHEAGGNIVEAAAPIENIPLYVRAGSILPLGPLVEYANEKPDAPIELRVYPGDDGNFTLYEDDGDTYHYEKGAYATIPITWDQAHKTLTIGQRSGSFPGMVQQRTFNVTFVRDNHGTGIEPSSIPDVVLRYNGQPLTHKAPN